MNIETKYNVGQPVCFLHAGCVYRRPIHKIQIGITKIYGPPSLVREDNGFKTIITYWFVINAKASTPEEVYKSETEIAGTKEDLINGLEIQ